MKSSMLDTKSDFVKRDHIDCSSRSIVLLPSVAKTTTIRVNKDDRFLHRLYRGEFAKYRIRPHYPHYTYMHIFNAQRFQDRESGIVAAGAPHPLHQRGREKPIPDLSPKRNPEEARLAA